MNAEQPEVQWGQIVARAWRDEAFRRRLLAQPAAVLAEHGLEVPPGLQVRVLEDTDQVIHLTLPRQPAGPGEAPEAALASVVGGARGQVPSFVDDCGGSRINICK
jgi:hypothetical protein